MEKFSFESYDIIGFDLDGTLLRYNLNEVIPMEFNSINKYLVEKLSYSDKLLIPLDDFDFLQKGLVMDIKKGNILKLNSLGKILSCSHGTKKLSESEICQIYGPEKYWDVGIKYIKNPLSESILTEIRICSDYFNIPGPLIFARIIDHIDFHNPSQTKEDYDVFKDIFDSMVYIYNRNNFAKECSDYFQALKNNPSRYILKTSPKVITWLKELKKTKAIFLLTGSNIDLANFTASYSFDAKWFELFDVVVTFARKPGFFTSDRPFYKVENLKETELIDANDLKLNEIYSQGNWKDLQQVLAKKFGTNMSNVKTLYVGDNIIQDIIAPHQFGQIDTVCVSEELSEFFDEVQPDIEIYEKITLSRRWSSYFKIENDLTFWSNILVENCKLCVPTFDYICKYPINHNFQNNLLNILKKQIRIHNK